MSELITRQNRLREHATKRGAGPVALVPGANMTYFTGLHMHLSERPTVAFVLPDDGLAFVVPHLEASKLESIEGISHIFTWRDEDGYDGAFSEAAEALALDTTPLGVDDTTMRVFELLALREAAPDGIIRPMGQNLLDIRSIKTPAEIELMAKAIELSEAALDDTLAALRSGMTEREISNTLTDALRKHGSHGHAFGPLVQTGPNSALPHAELTGRALQEGDTLLIDFGGTLDGYPADITRTFFYGEPSDEMRRIYEVVQAANAAGRAAVHPGALPTDIDAAVRDIITEAGYGDLFRHRTGHGLGLEVHELPQIAAGETDPLRVGMVFTIEPGVYVFGTGGVRVEDNVVVTADGVRSLTSYTRDLTVLPTT